MIMKMSIISTDNNRTDKLSIYRIIICVKMPKSKNIDDQ